jgi:transposase
MDVLDPRCAGLDVHAASVVACVRVTAGRSSQHTHRTVATTTRGLLELAQWLSDQQVTHVAMEATGVFWRPVWHVLEDSFTLVLANAMHIRNIPGRKSDTNDATGIADLLALGLIRSSFVPPAPIQELRDLTRTRKQVVRELGDYRLHASHAELVDALHGRVTAHHRFMIALHLQQITSLEATVRDLDARVEETLRPFRAAVDLLLTMPGLRATTAAVSVAEIGVDMSRFPSAGHLLSWAGLCPRLDESAGTRRSTRTRHGTPWLKTTLVQAAWGAARKKDSYFHGQFLRLKSRRGPKKAILAVAASRLTDVYYMLRNGEVFADLGDQYFAQRDKARTTQRLLKRLRDLGVHVEVTAA